MNDLFERALSGFVVVEGFQHILHFDGRSRTGVHFNPNNLRGESDSSGHRYVATRPSQRTSVETPPGVTVTNRFSVIFFISCPGTDLKLFLLIKTVFDADGDVQTTAGDSERDSHIQEGGFVCDAMFGSRAA